MIYLALYLVYAYLVALTIAFGISLIRFLIYFVILGRK